MRDRRSTTHEDDRRNTTHEDDRRNTTRVNDRRRDGSLITGFKIVGAVLVVISFILYLL